MKIETLFIASVLFLFAVMIYGLGVMNMITIALK